MKLYLLKTNVQNGGVRGWNEEDQFQQWQLVVVKTTSLKFNATEAKRGNHDWLRGGSTIPGSLYLRYEWLTSKVNVIPY